MSFRFEERPSDAPYVEKVWRTRSDQAGVFISQANSHWEMVITRHAGRTHFTVRGPETRATPADCPADAEFLGIVFKMGAFMPHLPISRRRDRQDVTLPEATRQSFWLLGMAWQIPDYDNVDTFINRLVRADLLVQDPVVDAVLRGHPPVMSVRTLQRRFVQATGLTHKTIQQIERVHRARSLLQRGVPIPDAALEAGYFDQSHLTNALKRFVGQTPAQITPTRADG
jgi:hypothetical protein